MTGPATLRQRLILAAAAALVLDFALNLLGTRVLPHAWQVLTLHQNSFIAPFNCVAAAASFFFGGWIGGRRFLPIGVALVLLLQLLTAAVLTQFAHGAMPRRPLSLTTASVLASNALNFGLQLLAAALGAMAGVLAHRRGQPVP